AAYRVLIYQNPFLLQSTKVPQLASSLSFESVSQSCCGRCEQPRECGNAKVIDFFGFSLQV
ncbi:MAG: hypothetical protein L7F78_24155, partial [Syntrophales bacterium LBB04]|nr:hypothetical protein [Syntrophales bacterium LBB04]